MMALRLKGPFLALIELAIYSEPLGSFYTLLTVWPQAALITNPNMVPSLTLAQGKGRGRGVVVVWIMFMIPALAALSCSPPSRSLNPMAD